MATTARTSRAGPGEAGLGDDNAVRLTGRVSAPAQERVLPSGDHVVAFRLVVRRGEAARSASRATVDVIDVACWGPAPRRAAKALRADELVEVTGALRRRFFRGSGQVQSRYEVEAGTVRRLARSGARAAGQRTAP